MKRNLLKQSVIAVLVGGALPVLASASNSATVATQSQSDTELDNEMISILEDISNINDDLDGLTNKVASHSRTLGRHTNRLNNLKDLVERLTNRVNGAANALSLLSQNIGLNKTNIEKKADKTEVSLLKNRVDGAAGALNLLSQNIG
ncbi:TPA: hypothetical protein ACPP24_001500, partial [Haemophilus influenzae]